MNVRPERGPISRTSAGLLVSVVKGYRLLIRAHVGNRCRFEPTCSLYAIESIERHGPGAGSVLAAKRLLRCHPWCESGFDPVPSHRISLFDACIGKGRCTTRPQVPALSQKTQP